MTSRDCNTCVRHVQGKHPAEVGFNVSTGTNAWPIRRTCLNCLSDSRITPGGLPYYQAAMSEKLRQEIASGEHGWPFYTGRIARGALKVNLTDTLEEAYEKNDRPLGEPVQTMAPFTCDPVVPDPLPMPAAPESPDEPVQAMTATVPPAVVTPLMAQVGGTHYKGFKIQPIEFAMVNDLNACQAKVIKYITRLKGDRAKRIEDLTKAKHVIDIWLQLIQDEKVEA